MKGSNNEVEVYPGTPSRLRLPEAPGLRPRRRRAALGAAAGAVSPQSRLIAGAIADDPVRDYAARMRKPEPASPSRPSASFASTTRIGRRMRAGLSKTSASAPAAKSSSPNVEDRLAGAVAYFGPAARRPRSSIKRWPIIRMLVVDPAFRGKGLRPRLRAWNVIARAQARWIASDRAPHQPDHDRRVADVSQDGFRQSLRRSADLRRGLRRLHQSPVSRCPSSPSPSPCSTRSRSRSGRSRSAGMRWPISAASCSAGSMRASLVKNERLWGGPAPISLVQLDDFILWVTIGIIVGGRTGYVLFYNLAFFIAASGRDLPIVEGRHVVPRRLPRLRRRGDAVLPPQQSPILSLGDITTAVGPIGLFLGRLANFINSELWGRPAIPACPGRWSFPMAGRCRAIRASSMRPGSRASCCLPFWRS